MKNKIFVLIVLSILGLGNCYEKIEYDKVNYSIIESNDYSIGTTVDETTDYIERVVVRVELDYEEIEVETLDVTTAYAAEREKNKLRSTQKNHHLYNNDYFFNKINLDYFDSYYICSYSPHIEYEYYKNDFILHQDEILSKLNNSDIVKTISVSEYQIETKDYARYALKYMNAESIYVDRTYTGSGVTIGLLDVGIIDEDDSNISGSNYTIQNQFLVIEKVDEHTNDMAQIIAGNYGIAKNAHLLVSQLSGSMTKEVEWMIENGADIINMSIGFGTKGVYDSNSAYVDYIVKTYGVLVCVASGNSDDNDSYVDNPGLAYNALSVGNSNSFGGMGLYSCYLTETGANKPNLVVPGSGVRIPNTDICISGTSAACAVASGFAALIFEKFPGLKGKPGETMAIFNAACKDLEGYSINSQNGYNESCGSGALMFDRICSAYYTISWATLEASLGYEHVWTYAVGMNKGQTIKAAYVNLVTANGNRKDTQFSDYDLELYLNGNLLASTNSAVDNVEVLRYTALENGRYELKLLKYNGGCDVAEKVCIAYYLE